YPAVLALGYWAAGSSATTVAVMNAAFGALACWLVWRLGLGLVGARAALAATALLAVFPSHVLVAGLALSETLFTCLVTALLLFAIRLADRSDGASVAGWLGWGMAAGATALVRSEAIALA